MSEKEDTKPDSDSLRCYAAQVGDYVLATKYSDGDPMDQFCVGFVSGFAPNGRFDVVDNSGQMFRNNGFRRAEKITDDEGSELVGLVSSIGDRRGPSVWWHISNIRGVGQDAFCQTCKYEKDGACRCDTSV